MVTNPPGRRESADCAAAGMAAAIRPAMSANPRRCMTTSRSFEPHGESLSRATLASDRQDAESDMAVGQEIEAHKAGVANLPGYACARSPTQGVDGPVLWPWAAIPPAHASLLRASPQNRPYDRLLNPSPNRHHAYVELSLGKSCLTRSLVEPLDTRPGGFRRGERTMPSVSQLRAILWATSPG